MGSSEPEEETRILGTRGLIVGSSEPEEGQTSCFTGLDIKVSNGVGHFPYLTFHQSTKFSLWERAKLQGERMDPKLGARLDDYFHDVLREEHFCEFPLLRVW